MIISNLVPILFMYGTIRLNNNYFNKQLNKIGLDNEKIFEYKDNVSNKFWEINSKGSTS